MQSVEEFWVEFSRRAFLGNGSSFQSIFRGEPTNGRTLIPSIARGTHKGVGGNITALEEELIREFKRLSVPTVTTKPSNEFEWLFLAQHYGLPTRLLDWTSNPLVGLYFAAEKNDDVDGVIFFESRAVSDQYDMFNPRTVDVDERYNNPILKLFTIWPGQKEVIFVRPRYTDQRYLNQRSVLSCHAQPFVPLEIPDENKFLVKKEWKPQLRKRLASMGISTSFIYPGLEGVAKEIKSEIYEAVVRGRLEMYFAEISPAK